MLQIGFTGTRHGMTPVQFTAFVRLLEESTFDAHPDWTSHDGCCVGADAQFKDYLSTCVGVHTVGHPPKDTSRINDMRYDEMRKPKQFLIRNREIVNESDIVIATPAEMTEQQRGGTWSTVRYTRFVKKPLAIVYPDGTVTKERWP